MSSNGDPRPKCRINNGPCLWKGLKNTFLDRDRQTDNRSSVVLLCSPQYCRDFDRKPAKSFINSTVYYHCTSFGFITILFQTKPSAYALSVTMHYKAEFRRESSCVPRGTKAHHNLSSPNSRSKQLWRNTWVLEKYHSSTPYYTSGSQTFSQGPPNDIGLFLFGPQIHIWNICGWDKRFV